MTSVNCLERIAVGSELAPLPLLSEQLNEQFDQLDHVLFHTMRIASSNDPMRNVPKGQQTRFIPCAWGVRRDDYRWDQSADSRDVSAFRVAAEQAAALLLSRSLLIGSDVLPGSMKDMMGRRSTLYLADYWVLVLHHLIWSKKLPYAIKARRVQGASVDDEVFYFVSELPVDLVEASRDALTVLRERALAELAENHCSWNDGSKPAADLSLAQPPHYQNGRWRLSSQRATESNDVAADSPTTDEESNEESESDDLKAALDSDSMELDDLTFTVCFGGRSCCFAGRNKQLFALLERISRRPGCRVSFDDLRSKDDVWDGSPVEDSTIRGAVTRLRKALKKHELGNLAGRITTGTYQGSGYVMLRADAKVVR